MRVMAGPSGRPAGTLPPKRGRSQAISLAARSTGSAVPARAHLGTAPEVGRRCCAADTSAGTSVARSRPVSRPRHGPSAFPRTRCSASLPTRGRCQDAPSLLQRDGQRDPFAHRDDPFRGLAYVATATAMAMNARSPKDQGPVMAGRARPRSGPPSGRARAGARSGPSREGPADARRRSPSAR